ncbi:MULTISPECIES: TetR/AcrR family transcriptional regulator [Luteococcus]|uniref:Transcriptional regulator, TetR family n=1 Tax=Luteococcus japonicus LSP_Lj1 TaxID=1255658 RepID=A0A1R4ILA6_9ACTN|nr:MULTISPECIES: TetR/AcrR family transcriptional regulator [Luteococcus]MDN5563059.1 TetR/AcrR family transcriptional regulator [Luteococcus sp.]SJN20627.1 Transcriptional regulator, TetR family [Luteococcus japonicus LSP_Lj1]
MSTPTTARRAATRERLVEAAIGVIAHKGVLGASVEEICEAADFTRGAFYSNFDSKDELCIAVLEHLCERHLTAARNAIQAMNDQMDLPERISSTLRAFIAAAGEDANTILVMSELRLHAAREAALRDAFNAFEASVTPLFADLVGDGLRSAGLRLTVTTDEAISLLHAVYDQTALDQLIRGEQPGSPVAVEQLGLVLRAMIAPAG